METTINQIYNMDCFKGFELIPDKSFDYAFTSPPYNRKRNDKYEAYDDTLHDYFAFLVDVVENLKRVVKNHIFLNLQTNYYNKKDVYQFLGRYANEIQNLIVWEKTNPLPANGHNITNAYEIFVVIGKKPLKGKHTYIKNHVTTSVNSKTTTKKHKAVMNIDVARWMFDSFIPLGSSVIDPFMGLGTTAVVCLENKCDYFGFELVEEYCNEAKDRIEEAKQRFAVCL